MTAAHFYVAQQVVATPPSAPPSKAVALIASVLVEVVVAAVPVVIAAAVWLAPQYKYPRRIYMQLMLQNPATISATKLPLSLLHLQYTCSGNNIINNTCRSDEVDPDDHR